MNVIVVVVVVVDHVVVVIVVVDLVVVVVIVVVVGLVDVVVVCDFVVVDLVVVVAGLVDVVVGAIVVDGVVVDRVVVDVLLPEVIALLLRVMSVVECRRRPGKPQAPSNKIKTKHKNKNLLIAEIFSEHDASKKNFSSKSPNFYFFRRNYFSHILSAEGVNWLAPPGGKLWKKEVMTTSLSLNPCHLATVRITICLKVDRVTKPFRQIVMNKGANSWIMAIPRKHIKTKFAFILQISNQPANSLLT